MNFPKHVGLLATADHQMLLARLLVQKVPGSPTHPSAARRNHPNSHLTATHHHQPTP